MAEILKASEKVRKDAFFAGLHAAGSSLDEEGKTLIYEAWLAQRELEFDRYWNPGKHPKVEDVHLPEDDYPGVNHE